MEDGDNGNTNNPNGGANGPLMNTIIGGKVLRSYRKVLYENHKENPCFYDAFFLDSGYIIGGERRKKLIALPSFRSTVISFVDRKIAKKDLNTNFYVQHPELEVREIRLTQLRRIKYELLLYALEPNSPLELATVAHAYWYFERLVVQGMVNRSNRKIIVASCVLLAIKFLETGDVTRKLVYFKGRWKKYHSTYYNHVLRRRDDDDDDEEEEEDEEREGVQVDWRKVLLAEFPVYVGLDFTLLPDVGSNVIAVHVERLLQIINVTMQEYYGRRRSFEEQSLLGGYTYYNYLYY
ncbi:Cyclin, N-terminal domain containing protein, putative [Angomonas deanei]|uniref:Cyclin, N-terminal domain containing protein, putative n=1 Tax=Angomonas deanei TaxID=59799 RepID=A0A7G2CHF7_9TRYP|nr:Cyclin, N-terminal domain containing protein, putative [Angomonas deanei]